jgi:hypothetical protein
MEIKDEQDMNYIEAHLALAQGKFVADVGDTVYQWDGDDGQLYYWVPKRNDWYCVSAFCSDQIRPADSPFRVVPNPEASKPEPQRLTFEEAVEAIRKGIKVQVQLPWVGVPNPVETTRQPERKTLCFLDLAERRGWPITSEE